MVGTVFQESEGLGESVNYNNSGIRWALLNTIAVLEKYSEWKAEGAWSPNEGEVRIWAGFLSSIFKKSFISCMHLEGRKNWDPGLRINNKSNRDAHREIWIHNFSSLFCHGQGFDWEELTS